MASELRPSFERTTSAESGPFFCFIVLPFLCRSQTAERDWGGGGVLGVRTPLLYFDDPQTANLERGKEGRLFRSAYASWCSTCA